MILPHDDLEKLWPHLTGLEKKELLEHTEAIEKIRGEWHPLPGPQTEAYYSKADILFYGGAAGGGKGLSLDTAIPTAYGWVNIGDIEIGEQIFDENGNLCSVIAVSEIQNRICYELIFDDGSKIVADDVHRWFTLTDSERTSNYRFTSEFREKRKKNRPSRAKIDSKKPWVSQILTKRNQLKQHNYKDPVKGNIHSTFDIFNTFKIRERINHSIDVAKPISLPDILLNTDPYSLGIFLGDGTTASGNIGMLESDIDEVLQYIPYEVASTKIYGQPKYTQNFKIIRLENFKTCLKKDGVLGNKHIPNNYLRASIEQRKELLRGILDTDGYAGKSGHIELGLSCKRLADDVLELVTSLGIKAQQTIKKTKCNDSYRISFVANFPVFKLKRKLERQKIDNHRDTTKRRYIVDIKKIESVPTRCIAVDSQSHLYLAGRSFIPTHNTDLLLGLAHKEHIRTIIFRREYSQLKGIIERGRELFDNKKKARFNQQKNFWRLNDNRLIELGACQHLGDEQSHQGVPHDAIFFDEITHYHESQFRFLCGWLRSTVTGQRKRIVCAGNPPTTAEGDWVIKYWAPWLDPHHANPAKFGELRWYTVIGGVDIECPNGEPFEHDGELIQPESRTYIPARIEDNPYLLDSGYKARLQALPEPLRSKMLKGDFSAGREDDAWQVIPTDWVLQAQKRWREMKQPDVLTALGCDPARGGSDKTIISPRYSNYFGKQICFPGSQTPNGDIVAGQIIKHRTHNAAVIVDVIGIGAAVYDAVKRALPQSHHGLIMAFNSAAGSDAKDRTRQLGFVNQRSEWHWKMREALDPQTGSNLALPDDRELLADLCAPRWELTPRGIKVEPKEDIIKRIGRSPDKGDSAIYALVQNTKVPVQGVNVSIFGR